MRVRAWDTYAAGDVTLNPSDPISSFFLSLLKKEKILRA